MALSYLSLTTFKQRLGIAEGDTSQDTWLTEILEGVEGDIAGYLNYDPSVTSITEYLDSVNTPTIALKRYPVTAVTSVYLDPNGNYGQSSGAFASDTLLTVGTDYDWAIPSGSTVGMLYRIGQYWPWWYWRDRPNDLSGRPGIVPGCLKVVYTVDNTQLLAVIKSVAYFEGIALYRANLTGMGVLTSDGMDGASVSITQVQKNNKNQDSADSFLSPMVAQKLQKYRTNRFI